jgi:L,D-peptidoglycan transpeptidase YkuD (ErfK/YbiS/YcfS/YnhG family)
MDVIVEPAGDGWQLRLPDGQVFPCAVGRCGVAAKRGEGDGITPVGRWPVRRVLYRPDRLDPPETALPIAPIDPADGWCDDPEHPANYNRPVTKPYAGSHEDLWRDDRLYDLIVVLGFNDDPPVAGAGSAIFLHVARDGFAPTAGCVALDAAALAHVVRALKPGSRVSVYATGTARSPDDTDS